MRSLMINELRPAWGGFKKKITIFNYQRGVLFRDGKLVGVLEPGFYLFWAWEKVHIEKFDIRQTSQIITGQEILTADRVDVRVSVVIQYAITDPVLLANAVTDYANRLHQDVQLALREAVSARELDTLLSDRQELRDELLAGVVALAETYGIEVRRMGIRDIILPGTVRMVMLKEVEADRAGRAELIRARHEVAAARARANTAKILSENPNIARMQELDTLVALAGKPGNTILLPSFADLFVNR